MIAMKIPQIMKYKMYLISMMINGNPEAHAMTDGIFHNACDADFGTREKTAKNGDRFTIRNEMWGNDIVTRGKRVDSRFEQYIDAREELPETNIVTGLEIDGNNPAVPYSYMRKIWDMAYPIIGHTYMIYPDPWTGHKLIDMDFTHTETKNGKAETKHGEMFNHDAKLADKITSAIELVKTMNTANRLMPKASVGNFTSTLVANLNTMSDTVKSNLGLPKGTRTFFTGNGMHIYAPFDQKKIDEWTDKRNGYKTPLICGSNRQRGFVRMVGSTNLKSHMQFSFPLFGWDDIADAFSMANPCFFALSPSRTVERTYGRFDGTGTRTTTAKLSDIIENYRKCCVPSSSKNEDYLKYRLKNENPKLLAMLEAENATVFGATLDRTYRWETIRKSQGQFTMDYDMIRSLIK